MSIVVKPITAEELSLYGSISPAYRVESVLRLTVAGGGFGGFVLREEPVASPYVKDMDVYGGNPRSWPERFDLSQHRIFLALDGGDPVGGVAIAPTSPEVSPVLWEDAATLHDIRVRDDRRGEGIGGLLLAAATRSARDLGARSVTIETQNVNVPACRFYAASGAELAMIDRYAYAGESSHPDVADEILLVWRLGL